MKVLVTGGAGYIGAHVVRAFQQAGIGVVALDDLSSGHREFVPSDVPLVETTILDTDAVQRALTKCFAARASYSPRWAPSTWLYRALSNVCIDELRRRRPQEPLTHGALGATVPRAADLDVRRAFETVPREARLLLALHYVDGLSYRELAAVRGISVNTVKSQLARGKAIMKQALDE